MKRTATGFGSTVAEAYDDAKRKLNAPDDAVIVQERVKAPQKKVLGIFGGSKAEVELSFEIPDQAKPAPKAEEKKEAARPAKTEEKKPAPAQKPAQEKKAAPAEKKNAPKPAEKKNSPKPAEAKKPEQAEAEAEKKIPDMPLIPTDSDPVYAYIRLILDGLGFPESKLEPHTEGNEYIFEISGVDDPGVIIGRRGDMLDAVQYLARLVDNRATPEAHRRVSINVAGYRERRNDALRAIAVRNANQVLKYGRNAILEPMNPYERRIIHTAVQEIEGVTSHSVGTDADRKVVITLAEGYTPTNPGRGGGRGYDRRGGGRGGRGGRGGGYNRSRDNAPAAPSRPPIQDTDGPLYGKIELPEEDD